MPRGEGFEGSKHSCCSNNGCPLDDPSILVFGFASCLPFSHWLASAGFLRTILLCLVIVCFLFFVFCCLRVRHCLSSGTDHLESEAKGARTHTNRELFWNMSYNNDWAVNAGLRMPAMWRMYSIECAVFSFYTITIFYMVHRPQAARWRLARLNRGTDDTMSMMQWMSSLACSQAPSVQS